MTLAAVTARDVLFAVAVLGASGAILVLLWIWWEWLHWPRDEYAPRHGPRRKRPGPKGRHADRCLIHDDPPRPSSLDDRWVAMWHERLSMEPAPIFGHVRVLPRRPFNWADHPDL